MAPAIEALFTMEPPPPEAIIAGIWYFML
jgi:hypothetical protein